MQNHIMVIDVNLLFKSALILILWMNPRFLLLYNQNKQWRYTCSFWNGNFFWLNWVCIDIVFGNDSIQHYFRHLSILNRLQKHDILSFQMTLPHFNGHPQYHFDENSKTNTHGGSTKILQANDINDNVNYTFFASFKNVYWHN